MRVEGKSTLRGSDFLNFSMTPRRLPRVYEFPRDHDWNFKRAHGRRRRKRNKSDPIT